ncbi:hypothetical protein [Planomonospora sp. ID82291]|uniref:hypothetical protein n=1 Tax=Planomonospora sp. ID82291 TaxID=2738136 RepID=UPI0018C38FD3|nr:hypothetical protein [Planomonospora sp. ID82291]MBG0817566.1 hypothetical protein [Planomonospora sp. ID82291]
MSDQIISSVLSDGGEVHAGRGDQYNSDGPQYNNCTFAASAGAGGKHPRTVADDQLLWLWRRFVHPGGFGRARRVLSSCGTVLLDGTPGSGRTAAAKMLLYELRSGPETFRELLPDEEREGHPNVEGVGDGDLVWLDLATASERLWSEVHGGLPSLRKTVQERGARLVVVLPGGRVERLHPELGQYRVEITRPPGAQVFQRYLRLAGVPASDTVAPVPALSGFLRANRSMQEIAEFAERVARARSAPGAGGFATWCENARAAVTDRSAEVARFVAQLRRGPQRALLLTAAMLHGAHADAVHGAGAVLLRMVENPQEECPLLERADLVERLHEIHAEPDAHGKVSFRKPGYDAAVRAHFWRHMPELREHLQAWVEKTVGSPDLDRGDRDGLVRRFAEQCLHDRYRTALVSLLWRWTAGPSRSELRLRAAAGLLEQGLQHDEHGRFFREKIFEWSLKEDLPDGLSQVLVEACWQTMAVRHPDQAMVRLHHLARREGRATRAREALVGLVRADPRLHRSMLERLCRHFTGELGRREWPLDVDLFLELAEPRLITDGGTHAHAFLADTAVRERLAAGWSAAFRLRAPDEWTPQAHAWLSAASRQGRYRARLVDVLMEGSERRMDVRARLYVLARGVDRSTAVGRRDVDSVAEHVYRRTNAARAARPGE